MKWVLRTAGIMAGIAALVLGAGLVFTGIPTEAKHLPTGAGVGQGIGHNVLLDSRFSDGGRVANGWLQEYSTSSAPFYKRGNEIEEIAYAGKSGDTGPHRKIEIFQATWHAVGPGQRWRFSIRVRGQIFKGYIIVGAEWFSVHKSLYKYIAEQDVYPRVNANWQEVTALTPPLPNSASILAVYIQIPEINPATRVDISLTEPSLILTRGT
jgi:hypothetical protein